jgi:hypothetical protein
VVKFPQKSVKSLAVVLVIFLAGLFLFRKESGEGFVWQVGSLSGSGVISQIPFSDPQ